MTDTGPIPPTGPTPTPIPPAGPPIGGAPGINYMPTTGTYAGPVPTPDERSMAMLAHLLGIIGFLGPLIIWLIKKDQSPFVNDQGKEALNFHLTMLIGFVVGAITVVLCIGSIIMLATWVCGVIFSIMGAMQANKGVAYRYPFAIRFIK